MLKRDVLYFVLTIRKVLLPTSGTSGSHYFSEHFGIGLSLSPVSTPKKSIFSVTAMGSRGSWVDSLAKERAVWGGVGFSDFTVNWKY